ncbi:MAG: large repetitive protein [Acidobacteriota bacterium]|jgi:hypothetical protein|nr:large repetitive protein [Acidobacteriota bacterium]
MRPHVWLLLVSLLLPALVDGQMTPVGGELTVAQSSGVVHRSPAVAAGQFGNFVVVWQRHAGGAEGWDVMARLYDRSGSPLGPEILVNTTTAGCQQSPAVAADSAGNFVVVWQSEGQDGSGWGVFGRRFTREGVALGGEISITGTTAGDQRSPAVARHPAGAFLVTWQSVSTAPDGNGWGVFARGFDAAGNAASPEYLVNAMVAGAQHSPEATFLGGSPPRYVVVWQSQGQDGSGAGIYRRTFTLDGGAPSSEQRVNGTAAGSQARPSVAADGSGNFIVVWEGGGLSGWRFNAASQPLGEEIAVTSFPGVERRPAVTSDASGNFIVAWERENGDADGSAIYARQFDHRQHPRGVELQVSSTVTGHQVGAAAASGAAGEVVVTWAGEATVQAQRYAIPGLDFHTLTPCRVVDTRNAPGPLGGPALAAGVPRTFTVAAAVCGVPASARALSLNLTVTGALAGGTVVIYPGDAGLPPTSTISFAAGQTRGNNAIMGLSRDGLGTITALSVSGQVHLILDVNGYFE